MTALPTIAYLRRHALPADFHQHLDAGRAARRVRLAAAWRLDERDRPVCTWSVVAAPARAGNPEPG